MTISRRWQLPVFIGLLALLLATIGPVLLNAFVVNVSGLATYAALARPQAVWGDFFQAVASRMKDGAGVEDWYRHWALGRMYLVRGDDSAAASELARAAEVAPDHDVWLSIDALNAYDRIGASDRFIACYEENRELIVALAQPCASRLGGCRGQAILERGGYDPSDAASIDRVALNYFYEARRVWEAEGDRERALALLGKVRAIRPDDLHAIYLEVRIREALGQAAEAEGLKGELRLFRVQPWLDARVGSLLGETALELVEEGVWDRTQALDYASVVVWQHPWEGSTERFVQALVEREPEEAEGLLLLGEWHRRRGEVEAARGVYRRVLELRPDHVGASVALEEMEAARPEVAWDDRYNLAAFLKVSAEAFEVGPDLLDEEAAGVQSPEDVYLGWAPAGSWRLDIREQARRSEYVPASFVVGFDELGYGGQAVRLQGLWVGEQEAGPAAWAGVWANAVRLKAQTLYALSFAYKATGAARLGFSEGQMAILQKDLTLQPTGGRWREVVVIGANWSDQPLQVTPVFRISGRGQVLLADIKLRELTPRQPWAIPPQPIVKSRDWPVPTGELARAAEVASGYDVWQSIGLLNTYDEMGASDRFVACYEENRELIVALAQPCGRRAGRCRGQVILERGGYDPSDAASIDRVALNYFYEARRVWEAEGDRERALALLGKVRAIRPDDLHAIYLEVRIREALGQAAEAEGLKGELRLFRVQPWLDARVGSLLGETALELVEEGVWDRTQALDYASVVVWQHPWEGSTERFVQALVEREPEEAEGLLLLGEWHRRRGEVEAARGVYRRVLELRPDHVGASVALEEMEAARPEVAWDDRYNLAAFLKVSAEAFEVGPDLLDEEAAGVQSPEDVYLGWAPAGSWRLDIREQARRSEYVPASFVVGFDELGYGGQAVRLQGLWVGEQEAGPAAWAGVWANAVRLKAQTLYALSFAYKATGAARLGFSEGQMAILQKDLTLQPTGGRWREVVVIGANWSDQPLQVTPVFRISGRGQVLLADIKLRELTPRQPWAIPPQPIVKSRDWPVPTGELARAAEVASGYDVWQSIGLLNTYDEMGASDRFVACYEENRELIVALAQPCGRRAGRCRGQVILERGGYDPSDAASIDRVALNYFYEARRVW
ncbi:MAG: tetratricopeptide repeat protein, partial [Anaerolineae bacterium]|nr:tetratricopeptide repeat protein [Anaerolineae bacterium]